MIHRTNADFWHDYRALPEEIRARADKQFALLKKNPNHRSLQFKTNSVTATVTPNCLRSISQFRQFRNSVTATTPPKLPPTIPIANTILKCRVLKCRVDFSPKPHSILEAGRLDNRIRRAMADRKPARTQPL
jgi:hypothetical protein